MAIKSGYAAAAMTNMSPVAARVCAVSSLAAATILGACASTSETNPQRTATEQLLVARAADRAVEGLILPVSAGTKVFVDPTYFTGDGTAYALSAIRQAVSQAGYRLSPSRDEAEVIFEIRAGALSLDQMRRMVGLPAMSLPVADYRVATVPELSLYSRRDRQGVAEFSGFVYDARTGAPLGAVAPMTGEYTIRSHRLLMVLTWGQQSVDPGDRTPGRSLLAF